MTEPTPTDPVDPPAATPAGGSPATPPTAEAPPTRRGRDPLRGSRTSGIWAAVVGTAVVLVMLVVFIGQNTQSVRVSYLGWDGEAPLAAALLIATTAGMLLAILAASLRILQLRRRVRRERRR